MSTAKRKRTELASPHSSVHEKKSRPDLRHSRLSSDALLSPNQAIDTFSSLMSVHEDDMRSPRYAAKDLTYAQHATVPEIDGLHIQQDEDEETRAQSLAVLEYLHSVRHERSGIPDLLTVPAFEVGDNESNPSIYDNGIGDTRGRFVDGVYVAAPVYGPQLPQSSSSLSPMIAYRTSLIQRYLAHRGRLASHPPEQSMVSLPPEDAITAATWKRLISECEPHPVQIASLRQDTVMRLLNFARQKLYRGGNISLAKGAWIWSLLAKLDEIGTLDNNGVSVVRELGKRAVWVRCGFGPAHIAEATAQLGGDNSEMLPTVAGDVHARTRRNTSSPATSEKGAHHSALDPGRNDNADLNKETDAPSENDGEIPDSNTRATLDMIIAIVGECYGQRDLLEFREEWDDGLDIQKVEYGNGGE